MKLATLQFRKLVKEKVPKGEGEAFKFVEKR
jgi:hypothetical protein